MSLNTQLTVGENIKKARLKSLLTQNEVAEKAGISAYRYNRIEGGIGRSTILDILLISKVLSINPSEILPF
jgi:transcriptional regulator with XRE-family HTH domain